jgi:hypothetical protein
MMRAGGEARAIRDMRLASAHVARALASALCRARGCRNTTSDRKPFCIEHIHRLSYVRALSADLARRKPW